MILAGPTGAGKYTLALMLAQAVNCLQPTESDGLPDFCGVCTNCTRIGDSANLEERVAEAVAARDDMRDVDKRETRILIQTHPDVLVVPPDPPQLLIKLGQVRQAIHVAYYRPPVEARRAFTIFTTSAFMKEAANSLLKLLEEPPDHTSLILLTENPQELLPTIRSRAMIHRLGALPAAEIEALLAERRPELKPQTAPSWPGSPRAPSAARSQLDLAAYLASRDRTRSSFCAPRSRSRTTPALSRTETYRAGADGQEKTINLLRALGSLVEDLLLVVAGTPALIRNVDIAASSSAWRGPHRRLDRRRRPRARTGRAGHAPQSAALALARCHGRKPRGALKRVTLKKATCRHPRASFRIESGKLLDRSSGMNRDLLDQSRVCFV